MPGKKRLQGEQEEECKAVRGAVACKQAVEISHLPTCSWCLGDTEATHIILHTLTHALTHTLTLSQRHDPFLSVLITRTAKEKKTRLQPKEQKVHERGEAE